MKRSSIYGSPGKRLGVQLVLVMLLLVTNPLHAQEADPQGIQETYPPGLYAELQTTQGLIAISLAFDRAPMTCANFVGLAEGAVHNQAVPDGTPYYDGTRFHRVVPGHVIQTGRPVSEVSSTPGYSIPNEIHPTLGHGKAGMVGMVNGGPHTGKAEFYITLGDRSYLDGDYAVFGEVYQGMDVVRSITPEDVIESVRIVRVGPEAGAFRPTTEALRQMRREVRNRVRAQEEARLAEDEAFLDASWPHAIPTEGGLRHVVLREGLGAAPEPGDTLLVRYTGRTVRGMSFASTAEGGAPDYLWPGMDGGGFFEFVLGESSINPGFDESLAAMKRGERRMVIVPADQGYDPVGFYGRPQAGDKRFVIRPRSILIYEIELCAR